MTGGMELSSEEGTTQGYSLSMAMHAMSVVSLINKCQSELSVNGLPGVVQIWYADDAAARENIKLLHKFWNNYLVRYEPAYGYFPKPSKTFLVVKPECQTAASEEFEGTGIQLTKDGEDLTHKAGQCHLGASVCCEIFGQDGCSVGSAGDSSDRYCYHTTSGCKCQLCGIPWQHQMNTCSPSLKDAIDHKLMHTLVKHEHNNLKLEFMRLPAQFGGMSFEDPVIESGHKHADSLECTNNLTQQILKNGYDHMQSIELDVKRKKDVRQRHEALIKMKADDLQR